MNVLLIRTGKKSRFLLLGTSGPEVLRDSGTESVQLSIPTVLTDHYLAKIFSIQ